MSLRNVLKVLAEKKNIIMCRVLLNFRWFEYKTEVLSCQQNRLVPASTSHRKDLIERIDNLKAGGTSELK